MSGKRSPGAQRQTPGARGSTLAEFLDANRSDPRWRGGQPCATCSHNEAKAINAEIRAFADAKQAGHLMPWSRFFRDRLTPVYGLHAVHTAILRHVRDCLELR